MKNYIIASLSLFSSLSFAQITIGKTLPDSNPSNTSVSLEFGNATGTRNKGIVLPWVTSAAAVMTMNPTTTTGTLIFDSTDQKVKYRRTVTTPTPGTIWDDLSAGAYTPTTANLPDANGENTTAKTVIGGVTPESNTTPGILVLGATDKAMVLPRVNLHTDIPSPSAGMMVYVISTDQLALYNGREWSFWTRP